MSGRGNGVFTRGFLDALQTGSDGLLTANGAFAALEKQVGMFAAQSHRKLTPRIWVLEDQEHQGTFVFVNRAAGYKELPGEYLHALNATPRSPEAPTIDRANWQLIGRDSFDERAIWGDEMDKGDWCTAERKNMDGIYRWKLDFNSQSQYTYTYISSFQPVGDLYTAVDVRIDTVSTGGPVDGDLTFRATQNEGYVLRLSSLGCYCLFFNKGGQYKPGEDYRILQDWTYVPIQTNAFNRLAVTAVNDTIRIYLNEKLYGEVKDGTRRFGNVGLGVAREKSTDAKRSSRAEVEFKNFELREIAAQK